MHEEECNEKRCNEREARSLALEKAYVHDVYDQIAPHFATNRYRPWPRVKQFLLDLEPGSLVCDVGCGNGKYLDINPEVFKVGSDRCRQLAEIARQRHHELVVCDNMHLPFRDESFDAALSIAVIHHFATTERRVQALRELARILRLGGRLMISVWAMEQRHRRFESQDVLVPWHKPVESSSEERASHADTELTSTTTSDDDILNYHAHSQFDDNSYYVPTRCYNRRRHRFRTNRGHCRGKMFDSMCQSSSQSSSDLSSPNETCYSFVRRALAKFSSSRSWDDPRQRCRPPWFMQTTVDSTCNGTGGGAGNQLEQQDSNESSENAEDLPIELRDVDTQMAEPDEKTPTLKPGLSQSQSVTGPPLPPRDAEHGHLNHKSKSLSDILSLIPVSFLRPRKMSQDAGVPPSRPQPTGLKCSLSDKEFHCATAAALQKNGIVRSKSSHSHLSKVDEGDDLEVMSHSTNSRQSAGSPSSPSPTEPVVPDLRKPQGCTSATTECRRPRSLILRGEIQRTLNADDHRNGNTILPEFDAEVFIEGNSSEKKMEALRNTSTKLLQQTTHTPSKRASWPVSQHYQKIELPEQTDFNMKSDAGGKTKKNTIKANQVKEVHSDVKADELYDRRNSKNSLKAVPFVDNHSYSAKIRLKPPLAKSESFDFSQAEEALKDMVYQNLISKIIEQEHLFPCHSMPELHGFSLPNIPLNNLEKLHKHFRQGLLAYRMDGVSDLAKLKNGIREEFQYNAMNERQRKILPTLLGSTLQNGYVKRSFSMDNPSSTSLYLDIIEQERSYCNRITKEDSLQRDTSFDSDDSVASVIAVTRDRLPSGSDASRDSKCGSPEGIRRSVTKEGSMHSDTSLDSEDSCISVIAMPIRGDPLNLIAPDVLLKASSANEIPDHSLEKLKSETISIIENATSEEFLLVSNECNASSLVLPNTVNNQSIIENELTNAENENILTPAGEQIDANRDQSEELHEVITPPNIKDASLLLSKNNALLSSQPCRVGSMIDLSIDGSSQCSEDVGGLLTPNKSVGQSDARKVLRKTGSLPEQYEQLEDVPKLADRSTLSASTDLSLADRLGLGDNTDLSLSGSLSSSRSSSSSSISWEKFLDASRSVLLDNIAIVTAGSDLIRNGGKGSAAILKNASQRSHVLQNVSLRHTKLSSSKKGEDSSEPADLQTEENPCGRTDLDTPYANIEDNSSTPTGGLDYSSNPSSDATPHGCDGENCSMLQCALTTCTSENAGTLSLLQAAASVANSLQSAVSVAVSNSVKTAYKATDDPNNCISSNDTDAEVSSIGECQMDSSTDMALERSESGHTNASDEVEPMDANGKANDLTEVEFKEAGVQTSLILYSTMNEGETQPTNNSKSLNSVPLYCNSGSTCLHLSNTHEDELNGNIPISCPTNPESEKLRMQKSPNNIFHNSVEGNDGLLTTIQCSNDFVSVYSVTSDGTDLLNHDCLKSELRQRSKTDLRQLRTSSFDNCRDCDSRLTAVEDDSSRGLEPTDCSPEQLPEARLRENEERQELKPSGVGGTECDIMLTSMSSSIENHFGGLEFLTPKMETAATEAVANPMSQQSSQEDDEAKPSGGDSKCLSRERSLSLSTSDESLQYGSDTGGSMTFHRYYHVFREGELDQLIEKYVENLHIISSYYDHANWCIIAEKVQVWRI